MYGRAVSSRYPTRSILRFSVLAAVAIFLLLLIFGRSTADLTHLPSITHDDDFISTYEADDPRLIEHMQKYYVELPNPKIPINLEHPGREDSSQFGQSKLVAKLMNHKRNGVFLEVGAYDGESYSNSLFFERFLGWTGLLIEADPANIELLQRRHRNAILIKGCVGGGSSRPVKRQFFGASQVGGLQKDLSPLRRMFTRLWRTTRYFDVWCFPMSSILKASKIDRIDYAVIDVQGSEMTVLKAIDWEQTDIELLQVEYTIFQGAFWDKGRSQARKVEMEEFVKTRMTGYDVVDYIGLDMIIRKRFAPTRLP